MLSFMKDGQNASNADKRENPVATENTSDQPPVEEQDFLKTAEHGKNLKQSTITLAILFTIGALCLWLMIKKVAPQSADAAVGAEEAKIEDVLRKLKDAQLEMNDKMNDVGRFYQFSEVEQIGVSELKKNPFEHETEIDFESLDLGRELIARDEVLRGVKGLQLISIMGSSQGGCCMINGKLLYKGDTIDGFTITKIDPRFVVLESKGIPVTLKMSE